MKRVIAAIALSTVCVTAAADTAMFNTGRPVWVGSDGSSNFAAGDFDGDGKRDFAVVHPFVLGTHLGNGDGSFSTRIDTPTAFFARHIITGDVNGDGRDDVVLEGGFPGDVRVMLSNGSGTFSESATMNNTDGNGALALGDFTGDGKKDVLTVSFHHHQPQRSSMAVFPGQGNGSFGAAVVTVIQEYDTNEVATGDLNRDGKLDVVIGSFYGGGSFLGAGDGTFTRVSFVPTERGVHLADFNADGHLDFLGDDGCCANFLYVALGKGDGTWHTPTQLEAIDSSNAGAAADMNGDGVADIVAYSHSNSIVTIFLSNGNGTFAAPQRFVTGPGGYQLETGDFDGDGKLDLLTVDYNDVGVVTLLRGNGDGTLRAARAFPTRVMGMQTYADPEADGLHLADFTGDGKLDALTMTEQPYANGQLQIDITVLPGLGGGRFGAPIHTDTDLSRWYGLPYAVGDFTGDGQLDVVADSYIDSKRVTFAGNGDGTFRKAGEGPRFGDGARREAGDFNADGKLDVLLVAETATVFPGDGSGGFGAAMSSPAASPGGRAVIADINADGHPDVVSGPTLVYLCDGAGRFTKIDVPNTAGEAAAVGDFDGDGWPDVLARVTGGLTFHRGKGDGTFHPASAVWSTTTSSPDAFRSSAADMNGDGKLDLIFDTRVFLGDGRGSFTAVEEFRYRGAPAVVRVVDIDADGKRDLVTLAPHGSGAVEVLLSYRDERLDLPVSLTLTATSPTGVATEGVAGTAMTYKATVAGSGRFKLGGAVLFEADGVPVGLAMVDSKDVATLVRAFPVGSRTIRATFTGSDTHARSNSASLPQHILRTRTWMQLSSSRNPTTAPNGVSFDFLVYSGLQGPTGTVTVRNGATVLGTFNTMRGRATVTLPAGTHVITAEYSGDANFAPTSASLQQQMTNAGNPFRFEVTPFPGYAGQQTHLRAYFTGPARTGTMTFLSDGQVLSAVQMNGTTAALDIILPPRGVQTLTATYSGDEYNPPTTSPAVLYAQILGPTRGDFGMVDGRPDLLWLHTSGSAYLWKTDGTNVLAHGSADSPGPGWRAAAIHDFDNDRDADVLWQNDAGANQLWFMDGYVVASKATVNSAGDVNWKIVATADFDRDGYADLLWQQAVTGQLYVWYMKGATLLRSANMNNVGSPDWRVAAVIDANGTDWPRIFWRHRTTGQNYMWFVEDNRLVSSANVQHVPDTNWQVAAAHHGGAAGDLVFWQHATTGQLYFWRMTGANVTASGNVNALAGAGWRVAGPR